MIDTAYNILFFGEFRRKFGRDFEEMYGDKILPYINNGYMVRRRDSIALTRRGFMISNYILSDILSCEDLESVTSASKF